ncbi:3-oxoacyl-[acyl-carrier-protein] reductase FabG [Pseudomonas sp. 22 E 5]|jgi:3-oxoacyl-[acyl-carrier protein] reductase|uniref:3-oxoacyl-ACP reductase n=1 Tax=Pseudomonas asgharzadehiana TaxID=2842349 RepID=A0ABX8P8W1_9PSED|nr:MULTISPECIES: 3-oxoacyl-ACP reductase [Pseudomonas]QXH69881.1 3-oxoacyl-ACP reductase [Pseudomonas asgharzadehiana]CRM42883.1 3-oxoacyl-[acyl-carrier-protein] reductase FabG [Pseudomonas sp. 31 E 5]CRM62276.1 3-oxoacyl-[acyl-carrier-protein] reductase FabG [Pseudomonas sp. 31 E 6]CRM91297.1 3-oxoacyl-[acyl-carrier-protein] reductase FabG [Pseudomonas sp. 22 E 5]
MSDNYLSFVNSPWGHRLAQAIGLPQPLPLQRYRSGQPALANPVIIAGAGRLVDQVQRVFSATDTVAATPATLQAPSTVKVQGAVFDATGIRDVQQLDELYGFFHANAKRLGQHARVVVLGTAPEHCQDLAQAIAQRALEGLVRSLAKELRRAITVQLLYVAPGSEDALQSSLRFFLSRRSAYVSGQVVRVDKTVDDHYAVNWDAPFAGRRALVTGASRGIGLAIAQVLARDGAHVVCVDVPQAQDALQQAAASVGGSALPLDITAADAAERLLAHVSQYGAFDVVVHNAGITRDKTIAKMPEAAWRSVLAVNLEAPLQLSHALLQNQGVNPGGRIVCVSSISAIAGNLGQSNYATSKAGVIGLVQGLAPRAAVQQVTVNAVAPGFIETQMTAKIPLMIREAGRRMNSMSQGGQPIDVAETIAWLAHPASGGVNGQVVRVCGQSLLGA